MGAIDEAAAGSRAGAHSPPDCLLKVHLHAHGAAQQYTLAASSSLAGYSFPDCVLTVHLFSFAAFSYPAGYSFPDCLLIVYQALGLGVCGAQPPQPGQQAGPEQSDKISHIDTEDDRIDTVIIHIDLLYRHRIMSCRGSTLVPCQPCLEFPGPGQKTGASLCTWKRLIPLLSLP